MKTKVTSYVLIILSSIFFGLTFLGAKIALTELDVFQVLACRWTVALVLYLILLAFGVVKIRLKGKDLKWLLLLALAQPCLSQLFETAGINMTTTSESAIIYAMIPIMVGLLTVVVLKKKPAKTVAAGMTICFTGIVLSTVFGEGFALGGSILGYLSLLTAVFFAAVYTLISEKIADEFSATERSFSIAVIGVIWFNLINIVRGSGFEGYAICFQHPEVGLAILFLGACGSFAAYFMFNYAVSHIPASQASTINTNLLTMTGVITGIIVQGDAYGWYTVVGMAMIVAGVVIANWKTEVK